MPNGTVSPYKTPVDAAIAGFERRDELQFVRVRQQDGTWDCPFFGYDYQVKAWLFEFRGTYRLYNRFGVAVSCLTQIT